MSTARTIRGGRGLGDSIYLRPIVEHFLSRGDTVTVLSDYPDVFLGTKATVKQFTRFGVTVLAHYVTRKAVPNTNQWQDICISAGVDGLALRFHWNVRNHQLVEDIRTRAAGRPIVVVHGGRVPMGRTDGFGIELLPKAEVFRAVLREVIPYCYIVRVGAGSPVYNLAHDMDLNNLASVSDLLDVASICDGVVGQCSYAIPLAEVFDKPLMVVWSASGLASREPYVARITPTKILSKTSSHYVIDGWPDEKLRAGVRPWLEKVTRTPERKCAS